jgi:hypothetical protein
MLIFGFDTTTNDIKHRHSRPEGIPLGHALGGNPFIDTKQTHY